MRILASAALLLLLLPSCANAASPANGETNPDSAALVQLDQRAQQADPREQCFRYTELAHAYAEIAGHQIAVGEMEQATASLKRVEHYAALVHSGLLRDAKKLKNLKNAELLMHQTAHRLGECLHLVSTEDKPVVQATLKQLDQVNEELLAQVFAH